MGSYDAWDGHGSSCVVVVERIVRNFCVGFVVFAVGRVWRGEAVELFGDVVSACVSVWYKLIGG